MVGTSIIGLGVYLASPDSQLKVKSWIRRIPMFWNSFIDSGYTPYFDPDYFEIRNGRYVRVQNNMYDVDTIGLPIVSAITPLNSFNMNIYRRYYQPIIDTAKQWQSMSKSVAENLLRKYIIERTRIVLVGHSCMIVKAWSGEHLLIHKSKYQDFIDDQRKTTQWLTLDAERSKDLEKQEKYIQGLYYFANKLENPEMVIAINIPQNDPMRTHYDRLLQEMAALGSSMPNSINNIQEVIQSMILRSNIPQSWYAVNDKHLSLKMADLVKNLSAQFIQTEILDKLPEDNPIDQTDSALNAVINQTIVPAEFTARATPDTRLTSVKEILSKLASGPSDNIKKALEPILTVSSKDQFPIDLKVLPKYALKSLTSHIAAYRTGYSHLHGIKSIMAGPQLNGPSKSLGPLAVALRAAADLDDIRVKEIVNNTNKFTVIELAKANVANKELQNMQQKWIKARDVLNQLMVTMKVNPQLHEIKAKHDAAKTDMDRAAISVANQKQNLERQLRVDTEIVSEIEKLTPKMAGMQSHILIQSNDLKKMEEKVMRTEYQLSQINLELKQAIDGRNDLIQQVAQMKDAQANAATMNAKDMMEQKIRESNVERSVQRIAELQSEVQNKSRELETEKNQMQSMSESLEAKARELEQVTEECREKTLQLAQMATDLQTFEERNAKMAQDHELLMSAIRTEGDAVLQQNMSAKNQEIAAIKNETNVIKQSLTEAEVQKQILEATLKATQDNAKQLEAKMKLTNLMTAGLKEAKLKRIKNTKDSAYRQLLEKFHKLEEDKLATETQAAQLAASNQEIQNRLNEVDERMRQITTDQSTTDAQKDQLIARLNAEKSGFQSSYNSTNAALSSQTRKMEAYKQQLAEFEATHKRNVDETDREIAEQLATAARKEAELAAEIQKEKEQAAAIIQANATLAAAKTQAEMDIQTLQRELEIAKTAHAQDMEEKLATYKINKSAFDALCKSVINDLAPYKNVIKLPLIFSPETESGYQSVHTLDGKQITIDLDLKLIQKLNQLISDYISGRVTSNYKYSKQLQKVAGQLYPSRSAPNTFLDTIPGKILEFVYSMYNIISMHEGISSALSKIKNCGHKKEQYDILNTCKEFITNGHIIFRDNPNVLIDLLKVLNIERISSLTYNKSAQDSSNNIFNELDAYTFGIRPSEYIAESTSSSRTGKTKSVPQKKSQSSKYNDVERSASRSTSVSSYGSEQPDESILDQYPLIQKDYLEQTVHDDYSLPSEQPVQRSTIRSTSAKSYGAPPVPPARRSNSQDAFEADVYRGRRNLPPATITTKEILDDDTVIETTQAVKKDDPSFFENASEWLLGKESQQ